jgi:hypothetical protein
MRVSRCSAPRGSDNQVGSLKLALALLALSLAVTGCVTALQRGAGSTPAAEALAASAPSVANAPPETAPPPAPQSVACHDAPVATEAANSSVPIPLRAPAPVTDRVVPASAVPAPRPAAPTATAPANPAAGATDVGAAACNPTPDQAAAAQKLVDDTRAAIARFAHPGQAVAAGYVVSWSDNAAYTRVSHYTDWNYWNDGRVLDPSHVEGLLYGNTDHHGTILIGAFYLAEGDSRPTPGGCLMSWHRHDGQGPWMMHVWTVPMPGGPFADNPDPAYIASL